MLQTLTVSTAASPVGLTVRLPLQSVSKSFPPPSSRPTYDELPIRSKDPYKSAWGLYGDHDELGTLNMLSPTLVQQAVGEIESNMVFPLALPLDVPLRPMNPARLPPVHHMICKGHANDDSLTFNTQASSHWDGLRHYPYQKSGLFYNGTTQTEVDGGLRDSGRIGVQNLAQNPIVSSAILIDFCSYAEAHNIHYSAFSPRRVTLSELQAALKYQGVSPQSGDVLLIRFGWTKQYLALSVAEQDDLANKTGTSRAHVGVEASDEMARFLWDSRFLAVASDTNAFEAQPFALFGDEKEKVALHEVLLSGWGMPIGELWFLEDLAAECAARQRWRFYLSSAPLNLTSGVASPPNAVAIL
ncbi:hypothetical protein JCM8547_002085 [Rhodosporidiobolus lusitaniae]